MEYLEVVIPTRHEMKHPHSFAERVRKNMAQALSIRFTDHTFLDAKLAMEAVKLQQPAELTLAEFGIMERLFHLDFETAKAYLKKFSSMDVTHRYFCVWIWEYFLLSFLLFIRFVSSIA